MAFSHQRKKIAHAQAVVAADHAANGGVVQLNGKMIDRPVVMLAKSVLRQVDLHSRVT